MSTKTPQEQKVADLRWPKLSEGLIFGVITLGAISVLSILLHYFYPGANRNPWLVVTPGEGSVSFLKSLISVFTTHFFHGSWSHLWSNLLFLWPAGLIAFAVAGAPRALGAIGYGILYAGMAQLIFGQNGTIYLGSSSILFALLGVIILASVRKGKLVTLGMLLGIGYLGDGFFDTIRPTEMSATVGISWLGHLGGLLGGFTADLKDPIEAVRVLHESDNISDEEAEQLLRKVYPDPYMDEIIEEVMNEISTKETETQQTTNQ
ncbi:MAG: rhomboid family intramembrane serine protease [Opitutaceae bacterium]